MAKLFYIIHAYLHVCARLSLQYVQHVPRLLAWW